MQLKQLEAGIIHLFNVGLHIHAGAGVLPKIIHATDTYDFKTRIEYGGMVLKLSATGVKILKEGLMEAAGIKGTPLKKEGRNFKGDSFAIYHQLAEIIMRSMAKSHKDISLIPLLVNTATEEHKLEEYFGDADQNTVMSIQTRFDAMFEVIKQQFENIPLYMVEAAKVYNADQNIVKLEDVYFFFLNKGEGIDIRVIPTITRVGAFIEPGKVEVNREAATEKELAHYLFADHKDRKGNPTGELIVNRFLNAIENVNNAIQEFIGRFDKDERPVVKDQLIGYLNGVLIPTLGTIRMEPFTRFADGLSLEDIIEGASINAQEVGKVIDEHLTKVIAHLDAIPADPGAGIVKYAIEVDSFGIYGMNDKGEPIKAIVDPAYQYKTTVGVNETENFSKIFASYIKTINNDHFFSTAASVPVQLTPEETLAYKEKAAVELVDAWMKVGFPEKVMFAIRNSLAKEGKEASADFFTAFDDAKKVVYLDHARKFMGLPTGPRPFDGVLVEGIGEVEETSTVDKLKERVEGFLPDELVIEEAATERGKTKFVALMDNDGQITPEAEELGNKE